MPGDSWYFVAIPLPGTGVWSGSLAAALLDIRFKWAFPAIVLGNLIAALLIMGLSSGAVMIIGNWLEQSHIVKGMKIN